MRGVHCQWLDPLFRLHDDFGVALLRRSLLQIPFKGGAVGLYKTVFLALLFVGPFLNLETIFVIADIVNGLMALPNLVSLFLLRKEIVAETAHEEFSRF